MLCVCGVAQRVELPIVFFCLEFLIMTPWHWLSSSSCSSNHRRNMPSSTRERSTGQIQSSLIFLLVAMHKTDHAVVIRQGIALISSDHKLLDKPMTLKEPKLNSQHQSQAHGSLDALSSFRRGLRTVHHLQEANLSW